MAHGRHSFPSLIAALLCFVLSSRFLEAESLPAVTPGEEIENATSERLTVLFDKMRDDLLPPLSRQIQDIGRAAKLPEAKRELLNYAAAGAIERSLANLRGTMLEEADKKVKGLSITAARMALRSFSSDYYPSPAAQQQLWQDTLDGLLSSAERSAWDRVVAERERYRSAAFSEMLMLRVKLRIGLSADTMAKLKPLIQKASSDYLPDLSSSDNDDSSIYSGYLGTVLMAIPEAEVKALMPGDKWSAWKGCIGRGADYWDSVKRRHEQRLKSQSNAKAKRPSEQPKAKP